MQTKSILLDDALKLPAEDRLELAERLFASVEGEAGAEELWDEEIARRIASIDLDEGKLVSWDEARRRIVE